MVKGLIDENNLINIADAIREKTGENGVYYPFEMADKILGIETGGGGLELTTSLVLTTNVTKTTGSVVLTAVLKADYDTVDTDLHGFLSNATILLYDSDDTLLNTGVTNDNGVVVFNKTISEDTTFYCVFSGTSDYEACISNNVTVEYINEIIFEEDYTGNILDKWTKAGTGNIRYTTIDGGNALEIQSSGVNNTIIIPKIFSPPLKSSNNFEIECDWRYSNRWWGGGLTYMDMTPSEDYISNWKDECGMSSYNHWYHLKVVCENNTIQVFVDNILRQTKTLTEDRPIGLVDGGDMTNYYYYMKNIKITLKG